MFGYLSTWNPSSCTLYFWCGHIVQASYLFIYLLFAGEWTVASAAVLFFHVVINVYKRLETLISSLNARSAAQRNLSSLPRATLEQLTGKSFWDFVIVLSWFLTIAWASFCYHFIITELNRCYNYWLTSVLFILYRADAEQKSLLCSSVGAGTLRWQSG